MLWVIVLITDLSLLRTEFNLKPSDGGFVVDTVILGHVAYQVFRFTLPLSCDQCYKIIYLPRCITFAKTPFSNKELPFYFNP